MANCLLLDPRSKCVRAIPRARRGKDPMNLLTEPFIDRNRPVRIWLEGRSGNSSSTGADLRKPRAGLIVVSNLGAMDLVGCQCNVGSCGAVSLPKERGVRKYV